MTGSADGSRDPRRCPRTFRAGTGARVRDFWALPLLSRIWVLALFSFVGGLVIFGFTAYQAVLAGGLSTTSVRGSCAQAVTGVFDPLYRLSQDVTVHHSFFPPSATCHWSGGASAVLVPVTWRSWVGPVLVGAGTLGLVTVAVVQRNHHIAERRLAAAAVDGQVAGRRREPRSDSDIARAAEYWEHRTDPH